MAVLGGLLIGISNTGIGWPSLLPLHKVASKKLLYARGRLELQPPLPIASPPRRKHRRIQDRHKVDDPAEPNQPEGRSHHEHDHSHEQSSLQELAQTRDEEAAQGSDHIACRSLSGHDPFLVS